LLSCADVKRNVLAVLGVVVALPTPPPAVAQDAVCELNPQRGCFEWVATRNDVRRGNAVATSRDGGRLFVTGGFVAGNGMATIAYDSTGHQVWLQPFPTPVLTADNQGNDVAVALDGALVFVTGEVAYLRPDNGQSSREMVTQALEAATGAPRWQAEYRGADLLPQRGNAIALAADRVFVAGGRNVPYQMVTAAYDAGTGAELWVTNYEGQPPTQSASLDEAVDVTALADGSRVFITGYSTHPGGVFPDWVTIAYDGSTGEELWVRRRQGFGDSASQPRELRLNADQTLLYVTGYAQVDNPDLGPSFDFVIVAYDVVTGGEVWTASYGTVPQGADDLAWSLDLAPDGERLFVVGYTEAVGDPNTSGSSYRTIALDAQSGARLWEAVSPLFSASQDAQGLFGSARVRSSADGSQVYVALSALNNPGPSAAEPFGPVVYGVLGFDAANGTLLWRNFYDHVDTDDDYPRGLGVSPAGRRIFVTGGGDRAHTASFLVEGGPAPVGIAAPARSELVLHSSQPNPFRSWTRIRYQLPGGTGGAEHPRSRRSSGAHAGGRRAAGRAPRGAVEGPGRERETNAAGGLLLPAARRRHPRQPADAADRVIRFHPRHRAPSHLLQVLVYELDRHRPFTDR
jgi:outer membrane protein assembly factor BamB